MICFFLVTEIFKQVLAASDNFLTLLSSTKEIIATANTVCKRFNGNIASIERDGFSKKTYLILQDAYVKGDRPMWH